MPERDEFGQPHEVERAAEEAQLMQDLVDGQAVDNYEQAHQLVNERAEDLLSPELLKTITDKLFDIHQPGIGFSAVVHRKPWEADPGLESVFSSGLLGQRESKNSQIRGKGLQPEEIKLAWLRNVKKGKNRVPVFFNITGRVRRDLKPKEETNEDITGSQLFPGGVTVLFDLSPFRELHGTVDTIEATIDNIGVDPGGQHVYKLDSAYLPGRLRRNSQKVLGMQMSMNLGG